MSHRRRNIIIIISILGISGICLFFILLLYSLRPKTENQSTQIVSEPSESNTHPNNYANSQMGISFAYPEERFGIEDGSYYVSLYKLADSEKYKILTITTDNLLNYDSFSDINKDNAVFADLFINGQQIEVYTNTLTETGQSSQDKCTKNLTLESYFIYDIPQVDINISQRKIKYECEEFEQATIDNSDYSVIRDILTSLEFSKIHTDQEKPVIVKYQSPNGYINFEYNQEVMGKALYEEGPSQCAPAEKIYERITFEKSPVQIRIFDYCGQGGGGLGIFSMNNNYFRSKDGRQVNITTSSLVNNISAVSIYAKYNQQDFQMFSSLFPKVGYSLQSLTEQFSTLISTMELNLN